MAKMDKNQPHFQLWCKSDWSVAAKIWPICHFFGGKSTFETCCGKKQEPFHGLSSVGSLSCNRSTAGRVREAFWKLKPLMPPSAQQLSTEHKGRVLRTLSHANMEKVSSLTCSLQSAQTKTRKKVGSHLTLVSIHQVSSAIYSKIHHIESSPLMTFCQYGKVLEVKGHSQSLAWTVTKRSIALQKNIW